ncbi:MAG TPA: aldolase/citrate lyase family protein [Solirubrobacteraceae bacterium]|jgi:2-keto-3-deoxy-L-rhamnonate aldolase RhmA|nr:aldolase/citrate lyase family protein [Solirubrobacteraceae bacterium]
MQNGRWATRDLAPALPGSEFVLTLWTDDAVLAGLADVAGIDRVGVDLEMRGKRERQAGLGTWISTHRIERLPAVRGALARARLFARVNPVSADTSEEVERLLGLGVEVLMLPMFRSAEEVARFAEVVAGRAAVVPLLETRAAAEDIERVAGVEGVREIHLGINDLALDLGLPNRFAVLDCELVERVSAHVREAGLRLGVGGIGRVDDAGLPIASDLIYAQYPRLGATAALISRAFLGPGAGGLGEEIARSRARLARWYAASQVELQEAHEAFRAALERCTSW